MAQRRQYWVVPDGGYWNVKHAGMVLSAHYNKDTAIEAGRKLAKDNMPSQLVVMRANGTIEFEWTYGSDPYPPRG